MKISTKSIAFTLLIWALMTAGIPVYANQSTGVDFFITADNPKANLPAIPLNTTTVSSFTVDLGVPNAKGTEDPAPNVSSQLYTVTAGSGGIIDSIVANGITYTPPPNSNSYTFTINGGNSAPTFDVVVTVHYTTYSLVTDDKIISMSGIVIFQDDAPGNPDQLASTPPNPIETATVVELDLSALPPTMQRVSANGSIYGSGITTVLTISTGSIAVNGISLTGGGVDATGQFYSAFYDPAQQSDDPTLNLPPHTTKAVILTLALDHLKPQVAGNYEQQINAAGTITTSSNNEAFNKEALFPVTVSDTTASASDPYTGQPALGMYRTTLTSDFAYNGLQATVSLPGTDPSSTSLVRSYCNDSAFVYSGGTARFNGITGYLDCGLQLGHTGNYGWKPVYNAASSDSSNGSSTGGSDGGDRSQVQGNQSITLTFEAPGFPNSPTTVVPDGTSILTIVGNIRQPDGSLLASKSYTFSQIGRSWTSVSHIQIKYVNSIAQDSYSYNVPPNPSLGSYSFYASGSFMLGALWSGVQYNSQANSSIM